MKEVFDFEEFVEGGREVYGQREELEAAAAEAFGEGVENVVMIGIGGTWGEFLCIAQILQRETSLPLYVEEAAEFCVKVHKPYLTEKTLLLTASVTGDTKETIGALEIGREKDCHIVSFTEKEDSAIAGLSDTHVLMPREDVYTVAYMFLLRFLFLRGEYPLYPKWIEEMAGFHRGLGACMRAHGAELEAMAEALDRYDYSLWAGCGTLWGELHVFTNCVLEEMQWKRTTSVTSGEFFHGPFELLDGNLLMFLIKGIDEYRPLDERVEKFARKYAGKFYVLDMAEYKVRGIGEEFQVLMAPAVLSEVTYLLAGYLSARTGHDLSFRRYYRKFDY